MRFQNFSRAAARRARLKLDGGKRRKEKGNSIEIGLPAPKNSGNSSLLRQIIARQNAGRKMEAGRERRRESMQ